jgi:hypothetical protein
MDADPPETATTVVRLFVGHASSPVWFSGPRGWDEMSLDDALTADLRRWDADWYASRDRDDFRWTADDPEIEHRRRGLELARRIADALGPPFVVQLDAVDDPVAPDGALRRELVSSDQGPTQPRASARFRAWADEARAEHARVSAALAEGGGRWVAYAPLSGETFRPGGGQGQGRP